jgi:hypothetical protein
LVPVWPLVGSAADFDGGKSASFELLCVGEFAATTTNKIAAATPRNPGTQFCKCSQSSRGPHRCMLNSHYFKKLPLERHSDYARISAAVNARDSNPTNTSIFKVETAQSTSLVDRFVAAHHIPDIEATPDTWDVLYKIDHYVRWALHNRTVLECPFLADFVAEIRMQRARDGWCHF